VLISPHLIEPCIKAGSAAEGIVLDPFSGSGPAALVANRLGQNTILLEINPDYADMARNRLLSTGIDQASISLC
jgi:DNA modification methylase